MTANANKKPKLTADAAYENSHLVAQDLVERIRELLFDMPAPGNEEHPIHWGHVGDGPDVMARISSVRYLPQFSPRVRRGILSGRQYEEQPRIAFARYDRCVSPPCEFACV